MIVACFPVRPSPVSKAWPRNERLRDKAVVGRVSWSGCRLSRRVAPASNGATRGLRGLRLWAADQFDPSRGIEGSGSVRTFFRRRRIGQPLAMHEKRILAPAGLERHAAAPETRRHLAQSREFPNHRQGVAAVHAPRLPPRRRPLLWPVIHKDRQPNGAGPATGEREWHFYRIRGNGLRRARRPFRIQDWRLVHGGIARLPSSQKCGAGFSAPRRKDRAFLQPAPAPSAVR